MNYDLRERMASVTNLALENIGLDTKMEGPTWTSRWEAVVASLSFVICSNNFWFFPFLCGYYGGWFPYQFTLCFLLIAVPLLYMEMALGQYASASPLSVFSRMVPAMAGLSAGMSFILVFRCPEKCRWFRTEFFQNDQYVCLGHLRPHRHCIFFSVSMVYCSLACLW